MRKETINKFKKIFESQLNLTVINTKVVREDLLVCADDRYDEIDQATTDTEQAIKMRLCNRDTLYLKKIQEALHRIEEGTFGECTECGENIELKRLEARPTAELCLNCKEEQEKAEHHLMVARTHKSMGESFSRKYA
jgi:DnaK suppressor protein